MTVYSDNLNFEYNASFQYICALSLYVSFYNIHASCVTCLSFFAYMLQLSCDILGTV